MVALKRRAALNASLLVRKQDLISAILPPPVATAEPNSVRSSPAQAALLSPKGASDLSFKPKASEPIILAFYRKGEASAEQFRPREHYASRPIAAVQRDAAEQAQVIQPPTRQDKRVWLRATPDRRAVLKAAAASLGLTSQAFLVEALDRFLPELDAPATPATTTLLSLRFPTPECRASQGLRVKLSVRVDLPRHRALELAAMRTGESMQSLLHRALDAHVARAAARSLPAQLNDAAREGPGALGGGMAWPSMRRLGIEAARSDSYDLRNIA